MLHDGPILSMFWIMCVSVFVDSIVIVIVIVAVVVDGGVYVCSDAASAMIIDTLIRIVWSVNISDIAENVNGQDLSKACILYEMIFEKFKAKMWVACLRISHNDLWYTCYCLLLLPFNVNVSCCRNRWLGNIPNKNLHTHAKMKWNCVETVFS